MRSIARSLSLSIASAIALLGASATIADAPLFDDSVPARHSETRTGSGPHVPPPASGIRLLEDIFRCMHSMPQLAINKVKPVAVVAQLNSQALADPMLSIKPQQQQQQALRRARGARIAMTPPSELPILDDRLAKDAKEPAPQVALAGGMARDQFGTMNRQSNIAERSNQRNSPARAKAADAESGYELDSVDKAEGNGSKNMVFAAAPPPETSPLSMQGSLRPATRGELHINAEEHPGFAAMSNAVNKLYNVTNQMQKAQLAAEPQSRADNAKKMRSSSLRMASVSAPRAMTISEFPQVTEFKPSGAGAGGGGSDAFNFAAAPQAESGTMKLEQPGLYRYTHEYATSGKRSRPVEIAVNVPNVVTGIPALKLGAVMPDAMRSLGSMYNIKQQQIEGWTVWSGNKPARTDAAVQLYIKHGMVEAMRIFDPALLPSDLGVSLGDNLQTLKSRFGEPYFMIKEPNSVDRQASLGQNYVYPISQVSFQLARPAGKSAPQVVSVLIFNTK